MATTTKYILTGDSTTRTHMDLGLRVGSLSLEGQSFSAKGSDGDNSFFLRPSGYSFDFTDNGAGNDTIYLTGARADYSVQTVDGVRTISRGAGLDEETVLVSETATGLTIVFADGAVTADQLLDAGGETLDAGNVSGDFRNTVESTGGVRIGSVGVSNKANIVGSEGLAFQAIGNGGVDEVFVTAGAKVDATELGVGKDVIYLEGAWGDYEKVAAGTNFNAGIGITLTRTVTNWLTGQQETEEVKIIGGFGASNDRIVFSDGAVDSRAMLLALRADGAGVDITANTEIWDAEETSFSSAVALENFNELTLAVDSGVAADDRRTNDGLINVSGVTEGYFWQYSTDGGATWDDGDDTNSFTLPGQGDGGGEAGITYAAGQVLVRQINPFGVASEVVSNRQDIIVDNEAVEPTLDMQQFGLDVAGGRATTSVDIVGATGLTVQYWINIDAESLASVADQQLAFGPTAALLRNGNIWLWDGSAYQDSLVAVAEGWSFVSLSRDADGLDVVLVDDANPAGATGTVPRSQASDATVEVRVGQNGSDGAPLDAVVRDLRIWNGARAAVDVPTDSTAELVGTEPDLLGYWKLNEPTGASPLANEVSGGTDLALDGARLGSAPGGYDGPNVEYFTSGTPLITGGGAAPFATIEVFAGPSGDSQGTVEADENGDWQLPIATELPAGGNTIRIVHTDRAGNTAETIASITVASDVPSAPDLTDASDSGDNADNVTNVTAPSLTGVLPQGTLEGIIVRILIDGVEVASGSAEGLNGAALNIAYSGGVNGNWSYDHSASGLPALEEGDRSIVVSVDGVESEPLIVTVDTSVNDPVIDVQPPALVESATFEGGDLIVSGTIDSDVVKLTVTWNDGDPLTADPSAEAAIDPETGTWSATFSEADLAAMAEGPGVTFSVEATDRADNVSTAVVSTAATLEFQNEAPESNTTQDVPNRFVALGREGAAGGELILDVNDIARDGDTTTDDVAFTDPDAEGSVNATLTYSAVVIGAGDVQSPLPPWLAITEDGRLFHVEGEAAPDFETMTVRITATDGAEATATRDITLGGLRPTDLRFPSDLGQSNSDDITRALRPEFEVDVPDFTVPDGAVYEVFLNDEFVTSVVRGEPNVPGLALTTGGSVLFTPQEDLPEGENTVYFVVDGVRTAPVTITVDRTLNDPAVSTPPPVLIEESTFVDGAFEISGTADADVYRVTVAWDDGDEATTNDPIFNAVVDSEGRWTATITEAQMRAMSDTSAATFTVTAEDIAGNEVTTTSDPVTLELVNQAPIVPPGTTTITVRATPGAVGAAGGTPLFNIRDLNGDGVLDDPMFVDNDAPGSLNAALTFSLRQAGSVALPDWLEITSEGVIQIKEGATVTEVATNYFLTATDGGELSIDFGFAVDSLSGSSLIGVMNGETEIDVRSPIVLDGPIRGASRATLRLTDQDGVYEIRLVEKAGVANKEGFNGETSDGDQTITVTVVGGVASVTGGDIRFNRELTEIRFDNHLDLASNYDLEIDEGLFLDSLADQPTAAAGPGDINFSTVSPAAAGQVAQIWDGSAYVDGDTWYDGTLGNHVESTNGIDVDLAGHTGVVVLGRDVDGTETMVLDSGGRSILRNFGGDDVIYIDRDIGSMANRIDEETVTIKGDSTAPDSVPTHLLFSGNETQAAAFIYFEDRGDGEHEKAAAAFSLETVAGSTDNSFEGLTGNPEPVISG